MVKFLIKPIICVSLFSMLTSFSSANAEELNIVLDPGHGNTASGCSCEYDGKEIKEKDINLKIALFMQEEFKNYQTSNKEDIKVYLTRENDERCPSLVERVEIGANKKANVLISLHNNAADDKTRGYKGAMALVTSSKLNNFYQIEEDLALSILSELKKIGITIVPNVASKVLILYNASETKTPEYRHIIEIKNGVFHRLSEDGTTYPNGDVADWYKIIRNGIFKGIPSILIEHAYLDNEEDYRNFLCTDNKLKELAIADVKGIAQYYKLVRKALT